MAQKRVWPWAAAGLAAVAASALLYQSTRPASEGDASAEGERREVHIGDRAVAVLEPGAKVHWKGNVVEQSQGSVFYRVERGDNFRVHTDAGEVQVLGT
jgi:ferric-dicitrate binding protein FerR (iron transport regulator)